MAVVSTCTASVGIHASACGGLSAHTRVHSLAFGVVDTSKATQCGGSYIGSVLEQVDPVAGNAVAGDGEVCVRPPRRHAVRAIHLVCRLHAQPPSRRVAAPAAHGGGLSLVRPNHAAPHTNPLAPHCRRTTGSHRERLLPQSQVRRCDPPRHPLVAHAPLHKRVTRNLHAAAETAPGRTQR